MSNNQSWNVPELFEITARLIADDDWHGENLIGGLTLSNRALVVRADEKPTLVWAQSHERRTGVPELDALLADSYAGSFSKYEAANIFAAVAELSTAVEAGGKPVGVVGFTYDEVSFRSAFHYPLERYKDDPEVEAYLVEQENALRVKQQAIDTKHEADAKNEAGREELVQKLDAADLSGI